MDLRCQREPARAQSRLEKEICNTKTQKTIKGTSQANGKPKNERRIWLLLLHL
jgi:hypothetical protein